jgi:hypothetical protein
MPERDGHERLPIVVSPAAAAATLPHHPAAAPPPPPPSGGGSYSSYSSGGARDFDDLDGELAAATGITLVFYVILMAIIGFFPCLVFCCAHQQCIKNHSMKGEKPTCCAWSVCLIVFALTVFTSLGVGITWLILPFFMIIPFCLDSCYEPNGYGGQQGQGAINITTVQQVQQTASPIQMMQMAPPPANAQSTIYQAPQPMMAAVEAQPPPVTAMPVQAYAPPAMDDKNAGAPPGGDQDLTSALAAVNLAMYEAGLRGLGVSSVGDIVDLEEADCESIGMKKLEVKRLMRIA